MPEARVLCCPNCGGTTPEDSRNCRYCRAPVATVRCLHCYHMNIPSAVHCSGCGVEVGLEPAGDSDFLACPSCKIDFEVFEGGPGKLRDCGKCGGQFVEHALVRDLLERREAYGLAAPRPARKWNPLESPVRYVACPVCREIMSRKNFGGSSGVVVDVCSIHGIWFDTGELPRILAFVESGGLARARRREMEELARRKDRLEAAPIGPVYPVPEPGPSGSLADYAVLLLQLVGRLLTK